MPGSAAGSVAPRPPCRQGVSPLRRRAVSSRVVPIARPTSAETLGVNPRVLIVVLMPRRTDGAPGSRAHLAPQDVHPVFHSLQGGGVCALAVAAQMVDHQIVIRRAMGQNPGDSMRLPDLALNLDLSVPLAVQ